MEGTAGPSKLDELIAQIEQPTAEALEVSEVTRRDRAAVSTRRRRLTPDGPAVQAAGEEAEREAWGEPATRAAALRWAALMTPADEDSDADREALARAALHEEGAARELFWRPWRRCRLEGAENFYEAQALGRGVIFGLTHVGPLWMLGDAAADAGLKVYIARERLPGEESSMRGAAGLMRREFLARFERAGHRWVAPGHGAALIELLARGATVALTLDSGGRMEGEVIGRRVRLSSVPAVMARHTGAPIVPALIHRDGADAVARVLPMIDPEQHGGAGSVQRALLPVLDGQLRAHAAQCYPHFLPSAELEAARAAVRHGKEAERAARLARKGASRRLHEDLAFLERAGRARPGGGRPGTRG